MVLYYIEQDHHIGGTKLANATLHTQSQTTPITTKRNGYMCASQHNIIIPHKMKTQRKFKYGSEHLAKPSEILSATNFFSLSRKLGFIIVEKIPWKFGWHPHSISHCFHYHWTPTTPPPPTFPPPINNYFANGPDVKIHTCTTESKQLGQGCNPWEVHKQIACGVVLAKALHHWVEWRVQNGIALG